MPQLRSDAKPRAAPGPRVKAASRASGSASALALTRETGTANLVESGKNHSTSNTVAEQRVEMGGLQEADALGRQTRPRQQQTGRKLSAVADLERPVPAHRAGEA